MMQFKYRGFVPATSLAGRNACVGQILLNILYMGRYEFFSISNKIRVFASLWEFAPIGVGGHFFLGFNSMSLAPKWVSGTVFSIAFYRAVSSCMAILFGLTDTRRWYIEFSFACLARQKSAVTFTQLN